MSVAVLRMWYKQDRSYDLHNLRTMSKSNYRPILYNKVIEMLNPARQKNDQLNKLINYPTAFRHLKKFHTKTTDQFHL